MSWLATSQPNNWLLIGQFSRSVIFRILIVKSDMMDCGMNSKRRLEDNFKIDNLFSKQRKKKSVHPHWNWVSTEVLEGSAIGFKLWNKSIIFFPVMVTPQQMGSHCHNWYRQQQHCCWAAPAGAAQRGSLPSRDWEIAAVTAHQPQYPAGYKNAENKLDSPLDLLIRFRLCTFNNTVLPIYKSSTLKQYFWKKQSSLLRK